VLVGYRVMPPWRPPVRPGLPTRILTLSSCLVDAVPDDDAWFDSPGAAARHVRPGVRVLAMGLVESESESESAAAVARLGTVRSPWPADLPIAGYELVSPDEPGFHSWHCFDWHCFDGELNSHGLVDDLADARRIAAGPDSALPPVPWVAAAVAVV
jgi:hypothetical protein